MDYTASGLFQTIRVDLIDRVTRQTWGQLAGCVRVSVEKNLYNDLRMGAQVDVDLRAPVLWRRAMLRVWIVNRLNGEERRFPLVTGVPKVGGHTRTDTGVSVSATVMDPTCLLDDIVGSTYSQPEGTVVTDAIQAAFLALDIRDVYVEPSTATLRTPFVRPPETTWRQIINGLGESLGYAAAWSDSMGRIRCEPYTDPSARAEVFTMGYGERSVTLPTIVSEYPDELPNHFVLTTSDDEPLVAEGWNTDPENDYSNVNQRAVGYYAQVEAVDQAALDLQLANVMAANRNGSRTYQVEHRWFPLDDDRVLELQSAGRLVAPAYSRAGVVVADTMNIKVSITGQSFEWSPGEKVGPVKTTLREAS